MLTFSLRKIKNYSRNLDYQCWLEGDKLLYKFFMKPMAKKTVIMMSSALSENFKVAALTQEVVRLSKNTSELVDIGTRSQIVNTFYERLQLSGYGYEQSVRIITSGLKGYERKNVAKSGGNINRSKEEGGARYSSRNSWAKQTGSSSKIKVTSDSKTKTNKNTNTNKKKINFVTEEASVPVVSVIFVPKTRGGVIQERLLDLEPGLSAISGHRICYTERGGVTMKQLLHRNNPWAGAPSKLFERSRILCRGGENF